MLLRTFPLAVALSIGMVANAQRKPDYVLSFDNNIENILINPYSGGVLVKDTKAITCFNPDTDSIMWTVTEDVLKKRSTIQKLQNADDVYKAVSDGDFLSFLDSKHNKIEFIPNSPFITLTLNSSDLILDSFTGELLYDSKDLGYRIISSDFLPQENALLLTVIDNKNYSCVYYDLKSKEQKWATALAPTESFFNAFKKMINIFKTPEAPEDKVITTDNDIYVSIGGALLKLDKDTGKVLWEQEDKITNFLLNESQTRLITMRRTGNIFKTRYSLNMVDVNNGTKIWKDNIVTKSVSYIEDAGDKILIAHNSGFNFFNYSDGKKVWKKDAKGKNIQQVIPIDDDYLYVADKEINLINRNGENKWKKFVEILDKEDDVVYHLNKIDNNRVFYLSDSYGNMVDYTTGKKVWKKDVKFNRNRPLLYSFDANKNIYIAYNDKEVYRFDPNAKDEKKNQPVVKLKQVKSDDTMADIELFDWGISLVSEEDVIGVDFDGNVIYHNTYKDPGANKRNWMKVAQVGGALAGEMAVRGGAVSALGRASQGKNNQDGAIAAMYGGAYAMEFANSDFMNNLTKRIKAMKANADYAFVLNKGEKGPEIVKVKKETGEEVDRVLIEGNAPIYEVDNYNYNLYFVKDKNLNVYKKN